MARRTDNVASEGDLVFETRCQTNASHDGVLTRTPRPCCAIVREVMLGPGGAIPHPQADAAAAELTLFADFGATVVKVIHHTPACVAQRELEWADPKTTLTCTCTTREWS